MASVSVKDRAKLFGGLASEKSSHSPVPRGREFGNNAVRSSPFLAGNSPKSTASGPVAYSSMSPRSGQFSIPSPKSAVSVPYQRKERPVSYCSSTYGNVQRFGSPAHGYGTSTRMGSPASRNSMEWPEEESIPAPHPVVSVKKNSYRSTKNQDHPPDYLSKPIVLPTSPSPINFPPQSPNWTTKKNQDIQSPLKSVANHRDSGGFPSPKTATSSPKFGSTLARPGGDSMERHVIHFETKRRTVKETVDLTRKQHMADKFRASPDDLSIDRSVVSDSENNAPEIDSHKPKSSRVMRLMRAKRATSPAPTMLKNSLAAARTVMEEVKSSAGSSSASSRSSLSNRELSDIASRALKMVSSRSSPAVEEERPGSVRGMRTISKVSHQEARLALLHAAKKKKPEEEGKIDVGGQSVGKVGDQGNKDIVITSCTSSDSNKSRRRDHPAFAGRSSPMTMSKVSSADIMSSFRQFNNLRKNTVKSSSGQSAIAGQKTQQVLDPKSAETKKKTASTFNLPALKALNASLGRERATTPKSTKEPVGKTRNDRLSMESGDNSMASQSSFLEQEETMHSMKQDDTMHSVQQDESMHSITDRDFLDGFYQMGKVHVTAKNRANEAYLSSLSSNTWATQSIMSQSLASSMKSPASKPPQTEKKAFLLEPTPEYSNQTMKSEILIGLSPGPSNRSARSFANSIVSASPNSTARKSPTFSADFDAFFEGIVEPPDADSDSVELLNAAIDAAVDDIMNVKETKQPEIEKVQKRTEDARDPKKLRTIEPPKDTIVPVAIVSPQKKLVTPKSMSILPNASGRSNSPPGFIFNDSEESDVILPPDPVGVSDKEKLDISDKIFGPTVEEEEGNGGSDKSDQSFDVELRQGVLKVDSSHEFSVDFDALPTNENSEKEKKGSYSSKKTVSTSIRTGFSSIQDEPVEGSTSIRTGLSGLQESQEKSNSFRAETSAFVALSTKLAVKDPNQSKPSKMPDTIQEESHSVSFKNARQSLSELKDQDTAFSELKSRDGTVSFSEFKAKSTSTTDGSSASKSPSGDSSFSNPISSYSVNDTGHYTGYTGYETPAEREDADDQENLPLFNNLLPPIQTDDDDASANDKGTSFMTPSSRKSGGAPWKGGNFGKRVGDAIKNVLAKASPRGPPPSTPSGHGMTTKQQESRSLFSSVDDDDDIFEGLEDDNTLGDSKPPVTPKTPKDTAKTPKQRNSKAVNKKSTLNKQRDGRKAPTPTLPKSNVGLLNGNKLPSGVLPKKNNRKSSSPSGDPASMYSDRSGTVVDEAEVLHVNSDITSSLIGGPFSTPPNPPKTNEKIKIDEFDEKKNENPDRRSPTSKSKSSRKSKSSKSSSKTDTKKNATARKSKTGTEEPQDITAEEVLTAEEEEKPARSMFMRLSCGGLGDLSSGFAGLCSHTKVDDLTDLDGDDEIKDYHSVSSHSRLTDLEKKVWSEWDRLNGSVVDGDIDKAATPKAAEPKETAKEKVEIIETVVEKVDLKEKQEDHDKKREAARDKLLDIASTAMSSHLSGKTGNSTNLDGGDQGTLLTTDQGTLLTTDQGTLTTNENIVSASESSESGVTKDTGSGASGASGSASGTESGISAGSSSQDSSHGYSTEYSSGIESDFVSEDNSNSRLSQSPNRVAPSAGPILLSFSQRSLMEKFSKQLTAVGVEVLKLNRRKQWQTRYFTVSKEQIALSAHEAISKTGELAHCPKALLWLKKFNPKNGGYGINNIDKDGHGGMLLVDLVEIQVSDAKSDTLENPLPKKLMDKFKESVLVTLQYKMNGTLRSIEFRCKDNDEAQFLCTCVRVIRDLLRRERALRQKSNRLEKKKASENASSDQHRK